MECHRSSYKRSLVRGLLRRRSSCIGIGGWLRDPLIKAKGFHDRFGAREHYLHEMCFYGGEYLLEGVRDDILKVKSYIDDVEGLKKDSSASLALRTFITKPWS